MAKSDAEKKDTKTEPNPAAQTAAAPRQPAEQQQTQQRVEIDDSEIVASYANFCRVTGTPEELIIDFGLNSEPMGVPKDPLKINQRIITNYFTAKRMLHALQLSVQRHEQAFGALEVDVRKRLTPSARQQMQ
jgi:hypothetical protein